VTQTGKSLANAGLEYSEDGYIRLTFLQFCELQFSKRQAITDDDLREELLAQDVPAFSAGYCDWLDDSTPVQVSISWAWFLTAYDTSTFLAPGGLSCNVMLTSADGRDLGQARTDELLRSWLSTRQWRIDLHFGSFDRCEPDQPSVH